MKNKLEMAKWSGELTIGDMVLPCSVLEDGTRLLTQSTFMRGMGMYYSGWISTNNKNDSSRNVPYFLASKALAPYVTKHLGTNLEETIVKYRTEKGKEAIGIKADTIPKICDIWLDAEEAGALKGSRQKQVAQKAKILMRALAHIGIIALVDEATGYQSSREENALQRILDKYLNEEAKKWSKTFPDVFWEKLIKVKGGPSYLALKRPAYVGHWVNDIVYNRLASGITAKLRELNPRTDKGYRKNKHHQYLTEDHGVPELRDHLTKVMTLMDASANDTEFKRLLNRSLPSIGKNMELPL